MQFQVLSRPLNRRCKKAVYAVVVQFPVGMVQTCKLIRFSSREEIEKRINWLFGRQGRAFHGDIEQSRRRGKFKDDTRFVINGQGRDHRRVEGGWFAGRGIGVFGQKCPACITNVSHCEFSCIQRCQLPGLSMVGSAISIWFSSSSKSSGSGPA